MMKLILIVLLLGAVLMLWKQALALVLVLLAARGLEAMTK